MKGIWILNFILCHFLIIVFLALYKKLNFGLKIMPYIGLISYTWYLTHNAIGIIIRELNKLNLESVSTYYSNTIYWVYLYKFYN